MAKARLYFDGDNTYIEKQARIYKMVDEIGEKIDNIPGVINDLNSTSETDALSAAMGKELQDQINALSGNFHFLSSWDCTTGLPGSDPATDPYTYQSGDYYIVSSVAGSGGTNYKPHGSSYTHGVASTAVETQPVQMNDWYVYDGSTWILQPSGGQTIVIDTALSTTSTNPVENRVITQALNNKQNTISNLSAIESGAAAGATALQPGDNITQLTNNAGYQTAGDVAAAIVGKQDVLTAGEGIAINNNVITNTGITCLTGGDDIQVIQGGNTHDLPAAYTELEYIYASGGSSSGGYIDTGFTIGGTSTYSNTDIALEYIAQLENTGSYNVSGTAFASGIGIGVRSNLSVSYGVGGLVDNGTTMPSAKLKYYINGVTGETKVTNDTGIDLFTATATTSTKTGGVNIMIYTYPSSGTTPSSTRGKGFMYEFKILDGRTNEILWHGIPAMRNSDDVVGMYDIIGEQFFTSSGNAFVAGPETVECTTVNFTNASGYVTINDVNVKVFNLSSTSDLTTAQAAYNFGASGGVPIIRYNGETFIPHTASFTGGNAPFWAPTTFSNNNSYTVIDAKQLYLYASSGTVTQVSRYGYTSNVLSAGKNYTTPYTPQYDGSPATKKYVDSKLYVGTTAPSSPTAGQLWYDTTNSKLKVYNGSAWEEVGSGGGGGSTTWGNIGGILSNQTDLQTELDRKLEADDLVAGDGINIQAVGSALPSGYTQLQSISSSGSQYILTGINYVSGHTYEFTHKLFVNSSTEASKGSGWNAGGGIMMIDQSGIKYSGGGTSSVIGDAGQELEVTISIGSGTSTYDYTIGGTTSSLTRSNTSLASYAGNISYPLFITTVNNGGGILYNGSELTATYYYFEAKDNDVLVRKMYPAKRDADSAIGMYDVVNNVFYTNNGGGNFIPGPVVPVGGLEISVDDSVWTDDNVVAGTGISIDTGTSARLPSGYTEVEYIQSDGSCAIDSGITIAQMDKAVIVGNFVQNQGGFRSVLGADNQNSSTGGKLAIILGEGSGGQYYTESVTKVGNPSYARLDYVYSSAPVDTNEHTFQTYFAGTTAYLQVDNYIDTIQDCTKVTGVTTTLGIFCRRNGSTDTRSSSGSIFKMKSIKMRNLGNVVFEGVPCKRASDNAIGLYDLVSETFLENEGSGTFTAGPVVTFNPTKVISCTVLDLANLTYDSLAGGTWTGNGTVAFPSTAKVAFVSWRATDGTTIYAAGETIFPRTNGFIKSSFVGGGASSSLFVSGGIMYDYQVGNIVYTKTDGAGSVNVQYSIYFYK